MNDFFNGFFGPSHHEGDEEAEPQQRGVLERWALTCSRHFLVRNEWQASSRLTQENAVHGLAGFQKMKKKLVLG